MGKVLASQVKANQGAARSVPQNQLTGPRQGRAQQHHGQFFGVEFVVFLVFKQNGGRHMEEDTGNQTHGRTMEWGVGLIPELSQEGTDRGR